LCSFSTKPENKIVIVGKVSKDVTRWLKNTFGESKKIPKLY